MAMELLQLGSHCSHIFSNPSLGSEVKLPLSHLVCVKVAFEAS